MTEQVTFKGAALTLSGGLPKVGEKFPECTLVNQEMQSIKLSSLQGKPLLILSVPSLDTEVCQKEGRRFHMEVAKFESKVQLIIVSMDLPFAQKRWCGQEGIKNMVTLSDFKYKDFAHKLGLEIKELGLLARAVFLCDHKMVLRQVHLVKEITNEPPYTVVIEQLNHLLAKT